VPNVDGKEVWAPKVGGGNEGANAAVFSSLVSIARSAFCAAFFMSPVVLFTFFKPLAFGRLDGLANGLAAAPKPVEAKPKVASGPKPVSVGSVPSV